jgi:O-antigen/teichoic acid export membrane protein
MLHRLRPRVLESSFLRKFSMLASGTIVGQALIILSSPLLTRLYRPEDFGIFAVFGSLVAIGGVVVALRCEYGIAAAEDDQDAAAMVLVTAAISALMALLFAWLVWVFGGWFVDLVNVAALQPWLWLVPPATFLWGLGSALTYWSVRQKDYKVNAVNRILQFGSQAGGQVGLGFLGTGVPGLILGYLLGYIVRLGHFLVVLPAGTVDRLRRQRAGSLWRVTRENWRHFAFVFPAAALQSICQHAPAILLAALYGPALAGFFALSQRIMAMPVRILGEAASKVFLGELRSVENGEIERYVLRTCLLFVCLGGLGTLPLLLFGPSLFALAFGEPWRETGVIAQLLIPLFLAKFIGQPLSMILYYFRTQQIYLLTTASLNATALFACFGAAKFLALEARTVILLFSLTSGFSYLLTIYLSWQQAQRADRLVLE